LGDDECGDATLGVFCVDDDDGGCDAEWFGVRLGCCAPGDGAIEENE
jgi:hypothetical protein